MPEFDDAAERFKGLPTPEYGTLRQTHGNKVDSDSDYENCTPGGESYGDTPGEKS